MALVERREIQYNKPSEGRAAHIRAALPFLFGTIGFSIPGAFAAKLLNPDKKVLAVCGDGGFMMNSQELETAVREKAPVRPKRMDAFLIASIASKEMQVPRKKLVKRPNREKRAKKVEKRGCQTGGCMVLYLSAKR